METNPVIEKKQLREQMHSFNQLYDWENISLSVLENLRKFSSQFSKKAIIGAYWPIKGEINNLPFLKEWCDNDGTVCLPSIEDNQSPLAFYTWTPQTEMEIGQYQIPIPRQREKKVLPDILLVPLLAFDKEGYRLGRGIGFYDRTLHDLRLQKNIYAMGLALEHQLISSIPHESHDEKLDCVITDKKVYVCCTTFKEPHFL